MTMWTPIVNGNTIKVLNIGDRVRIKNQFYLPCLSGAQMKLGMVEGAEGVILSLRGIAKSEFDRQMKRPEAIEFKLRLDDGSERTITVPFTKEGVLSIEVPIPDNPN